MTKISILLMMSVLLSACSDNEDKLKEATSTDQPVIKSETSDQNMMPPAADQPSAADVKQSEDLGMEDIPPENSVSSVSTGETLYLTCAGCHGQAGEGGVGPKLQGQDKDTLAASLLEYKAGKQKGPMSGMMIPNAQSLSDEEITLVSEYISQF